MNPNLVVGRIVWTELFDPQGRNPKIRPAILVSPSTSNTGSIEWLAIAVSTKFDAAPSEVCVELSWHRDGHPRTKLKSRSVAVCTWQEFLSPDHIVELAGFTPLPYLQRILAILDTLSGNDPGVST